jgi:hypothetical protein
MFAYLALLSTWITGIQIFEELEWRLIEIQDINEMLCEPSHFQMPMWSNVPISRD